MEGEAEEEAAVEAAEAEAAEAARLAGNLATRRSETRRTGLGLSPVWRP